MPAQDRDTLKRTFESGDKPTEAQFIDLIDSFQLVADLIIDDNTGDIVTADGEPVLAG